MPGVGYFGELGQVGTVAFPREEVDFPAGKGARRENGLRQSPAFHRIVVAIEIVSENHGTAAEKIREYRVVVELRAQFLQGRLERPYVLQPGLGQLLEHRQAGALVGLGKHDVQADYEHAVFVEKLLKQGNDLVAAPGPATERAGIQAALVDIEDDDAVIDRARHGQPKPVVVDDVVELLDEADVVALIGISYDVAYEYQHYQQAERDPDDVLLQSSSPGSVLLKTRGSGLEEEFHLDPGKFDHVMVVQRVRLGVEGLAVHDRKACALYVGDEKALGTTRDDGHLDTGFAERRERLGEIELLAGIGPGEKLQRGIFLRRGRRLGGRDRCARRTLGYDGVAEIFCACGSRHWDRGGGRRGSGSRC